jgi:hypothetical protein
MVVAFLPVMEKRKHDGHPRAWTLASIVLMLLVTSAAALQVSKLAQGRIAKRFETIAAAVSEAMRPHR